MKGPSLNFDYSERRVLVTGGSNGIGANIAHAFQQAGASVTITGTRPKASDYDSDLSCYEYRCLEMEDRDALDALPSSLPGLDVLVNNAGQTLPGGQNEYIPEVFERSVAINLFGAFRLAVACKSLLENSSQGGGASVINLASMSSFFSVPIVPGYGAAKAAVVQMTKNLGVAWASDHIRVNAVAPGLIESNMTKLMKGVEALERPQLDRTPMGRWGTPEDVSPAVLFLASEGARFITGQTLCVDGGFSAA